MGRMLKCLFAIVLERVGEGAFDTSLQERPDGCKGELA